MIVKLVINIVQLIYTVGGVDMKRNLYRSNEDKILGGVCGGLAEYFEVSSALIRLLWLLLILIDGIGLLLYIFAWIIIPKKPVTANNDKDDSKNFNTNDSFNDSSKKEQDERDNFVLGAIFLVIGTFLLLVNFIPNILAYFNVFVGILFLILGIYLVIKRR